MSLTSQSIEAGVLYRVVEGYDDSGHIVRVEDTAPDGEYRTCHVEPEIAGADFHRAHQLERVSQAEAQQVQLRLRLREAARSERLVALRLSDGTVINAVKVGAVYAADQDPTVIWQQQYHWGPKENPPSLHFCRYAGDTAWYTGESLLLSLVTRADFDYQAQQRLEDDTKARFDQEMAEFVYPQISRALSSGQGLDGLRAALASESSSRLEQLEQLIAQAREQN